MEYIDFKYSENERLMDIDDSQMRLLFLLLIGKAFEMNGQSKDGSEIATIYSQMLYALRKRFNYMYISWIIKAFENGNETDDRLNPKTFIKWLIVSNRQLEDSRKSGMAFSEKKIKDEERMRPKLLLGYSIDAIAYMLRSIHEPGRETISFDERVKSIEKGINPYTKEPLDKSHIALLFKSENSINKRVRV